MGHFDILIKLLIAHLLGDFFFQPKRWTNKRQRYKFRSVHLYFHAFVHGVLAYILIGDWSQFLIPVVIILFHFIFDGLKAYFIDRPILFFIDQGLHILVFFFLWIAFYGNWSMISEMTDSLSNPLVLIVLVAYLLILSPAAVIVRIMTEKYQPDMSHGPAGFMREKETEEIIGLKDAGRFIGILERFLILTFILLQQYMLIGLLIAAKSVLRYSDIKSNYDRKRVEYILIGTLLSFSIAIITGIFAVGLLKQM